MKMLLSLIVGIVSCSCYSFGTWDEARLSTLLRNSGRFVESDYDEDDEEDVPNWERDALPLFKDVLEESGWTTNQLIQSLINIASNGLSNANWQNPDMRRSTAMAFKQLSDINQPVVTNYFHSVIGCDLKGLESVVIPALFKYSHLESDVFDILYRTCIETNSYDRAAPEVAMGLLDGLNHVPLEDREAARRRVAQFLYYSMRQISSSQTWQDEQLAKLIPAYSNSIQRLEQVDYLRVCSTQEYEREKSLIQYNRLNAIPTNQLNDVSWILTR